MNPNIAHLLNPPLPKSIGNLVSKALVKTLRMNTPSMGIRSIRDITSVGSYSVSSLAEIAVHPSANFAQLPIIARFNAIDAAKQARAEGVYSRIAWTTNDAFFSPSPSDIDYAKSQAIGVAIFKGEHDELVLRPELFLNQVFNATDSV